MSLLISLFIEVSSTVIEQGFIFVSFILLVMRRKPYNHSMCLREVGSGELRSSRLFFDKAIARMAVVVDSVFLF